MRFSKRRHGNGRIDRIGSIRRALAIGLLVGLMAIHADGAASAGVVDLGDGVRKWTISADGDPRPAFFRRLEQISGINIRDPEALPFGRSVAFLAGVARYDALTPQLPNVDTDLDRLRNYLLSAGGFDEVFEVRGATVTGALIEKYMDHVFPEQLGSSDRLLFYFGGHGADFEGKGHMQFAGAAPDACDAGNCLPVSVCRQWSARLPVRHALFIFDCCVSGLDTLPGNGAGSARTEIRNTFSGEGSRMAIVACRAGEHPFRVAEQGVFARALLDAFHSNSHTYGFLTARQIFSKLDFSVKKSALKAGASLTPRYWNLDREQLGAFLFLNARIKGIALPPWVVRQMMEPPRKPDGTGILHVTAELDGILMIDGEIEGSLTAGDSLKSVQPSGTHRIEFQAKTFRFRKEVRVEAEKTHDVFIRTDPSEKRAEPAQAVVPAIERPKITIRKPKILIDETASPESAVPGKPAAPALEPMPEIAPTIEKPESEAALPVEETPAPAAETAPEMLEETPEPRPETSAGPPIPRYGNVLGMTFIYLPPGTFMMGSPYDDPERETDEVPHEVTLTNGFYMQSTEITIRQWRAFVNATGYRTEAETQVGAFGWTGEEWAIRPEFNWKNPGFAQDPDHPVTCVSWNDAMAFAEWLSQREKRNYDLPTEAEWEYACRAGTTGHFAFGDCISTDQVNYDGTYPLAACPEGLYRQTTIPAGSLAANAWGLFDMHGNAWEWCRDFYGRYPMEAVTDPTGPADDVYHVLRGGSWGDGAKGCRSADRRKMTAAYRVSLAGFRLVMRP